MPLSRRALIATPALFAFRDGTRRSLDRLDFARGAPDDEDFWREVRGLFDLADDATSFNHAGLSPSPRAVRDTMAAQVARADRDPSRVLWREQEKELEAVRERLARLVGCVPEELALVANATFGLHTAILGLSLRAGDEVLTTSHDYPRARNALRQRERRDGTTTVVVPLASPPEAPEAVAAAILAKVTNRTKLAVLSQRTYLTGQPLPTALVAPELQRRGIPLLVDGAHGIGLDDAPLDALGATFYAACLHKWLMGPIGTGLFVVRSAWLDKVWPLHPGEEDLDRRITKFEQIGTHPAAPFLALHGALDLHERLGAGRKRARLQWLRERLAAPLLGEPGVVHFGSLDPARGGAMLTVGFANVKPRALVAWLWQQHRIHTTAAEDGGVAGVRLSPHVFTSAAEVDRLAGILVGVARRGL